MRSDGPIQDAQSRRPPGLAPRCLVAYTCPRRSGGGHREGEPSGVFELRNRLVSDRLFYVRGLVRTKDAQPRSG